MNYNTHHSHRPNKWGRLKAKLAEANRNAERWFEASREIAERLALYKMKCETYQEQNAALILMNDTLERRVNKLIGMLETLSDKNAELVRNKH